MNWNAAVFKFGGTPKSPARFGFARFANKVDSHVPLPGVVIQGIRVPKWSVRCVPWGDSDGWALSAL